MKTDKNVLKNGAAKITGGLWWMDSNNEILSMPSQIKICKVYPISENDSGQANARLIAAAPDLLEALDKIISESYKKLERGEIDNFTGAVIETAKQAILKAVITEMDRGSNIDNEKDW